MRAQEITILDVAKKAGVAPGTVSRALSNTGYMKDETRRKVAEAVKELNYIPNRTGRTLKTTRTGLIMLAIPDTANNIYVGMIEAVHECAMQYGCSMVLFFTNGLLEGELNAVRMLQEHLVDGLFLINFSYTDELRRTIDNCSSPVALCGMCNSLWAEEEKKTFSTISIDVYEGVYAMTCEMIRRGHRRIAYLAGILGFEVYLQRYRAFCNALSDHGLRVREEDVFWQDYTKKNGYRAAEVLCAREQRPDAMVASNDLQALGFWEGCRDLGVTIPGDMALSGLDNLDEMRMLHLSSIRMMEDKVGTAGAEIILRQLEKGKKLAPCCDLRFTPQMVLRKSM